MRPVLLLAFLAASPLLADEVYLRGGGHVKGIIVERSESKVVLDVGAGRIGLPTSRIERIVEGTTALGTYLERAGRLAGDDVAGWLALAYWAQERDLQTQARDAFQRVASLDPENAAAQQAAGRVLVAGDWVTAEEAYRARGFVPFEGSWVSPAEREAILGQRREDSEAERARVESDARVREAEARARVAEAEAQRAEAEAEAASYDGGIPLGYGFYGGYGLYGGGYGGYGGGMPAGGFPRHPRGHQPGGPCQSCPIPRAGPRPAAPLASPPQPLPVERKMVH
jgi:hypothetical protein